MKRVNQTGFTVIETMLFLAITAMLMMSVIVGSNTSINRQRYVDSVNTLKSILQQQYSDTENTIHATSSTMACNAATGAITDSGTLTTSGQTDCVLLGKFITTQDTKHIRIYDVVGTIPTGSLLGLDDTTIFIKNTVVSPPTGYGTYISDEYVLYQIDWGASLTNTSGNGILFSMAILRSPLSGNIVTFYDQAVSPAAPDDNIAIINTANIVAANICINPEGLMGGRKMAIGIAAGATNASGVKTIPEDASGCN